MRISLGTGELQFEEFCRLAARFIVEEDTEAIAKELREAFLLYDREGNGYITTDVFRDILSELDDNLPEEELDMMIEEIDADGSGTVDFEGFNDFHKIHMIQYIKREKKKKLLIYSLLFSSSSSDYRIHGCDDRRINELSKRKKRKIKKKKILA